MAVFIFFLLSLPPIFFTLRKFKRKDDINFFDINILATFLYFVFIPVYYYLIGEEYAVDLLEKGKGTFIIIEMYIYAIHFFNKLVSKSEKHKKSLLNLSHQLRKYYYNITYFKKWHLYLILFILLLNLYSNLFYSNLQGKNLSNADMEAIYTEQVNTTDHVNNKLKGIYNFFLIPTLLYGVVMIKKSPKRVYKNIGWCIVGISSVIFLLGSRRPMIAALVFMLLFLYSINRQKIKKKTILKLAVVFGLIIGVFFPAYQIYRLVKEYSLLNDTNVDFVSVVSSSKDVLLDSDFFQEAKDSNSKRSLGLFYALDSAVKNDTYNGWVVWKCITNFMPGAPSLEDNVEYQLANTYAHRGADIADSIIMYGVADFSFIGALFSLFYILFFYKIYKFFIRVFKKYDEYYLFSIYFLYKIYDVAFSLEFSPFWTVKTFVTILFISIITATILYISSNHNQKIYL